MYNANKLMYSAFLLRRRILVVVVHAGVNIRENGDFDYNSTIEKYRFGVIVFKSPAEVFLDDSYVPIEPGTAVIWCGEDRMRYRARECKEFVHDFVYFGYSAAGVSFFSQFPVKKPITLFYADELSRILQLIIDEARLKREFHSDIICHLNFLYCFNLKREIELQSKIPENRAHYPKMSALRNEIYSNPERDWNVSEMSAHVHLSESHFQHLYKYYFNDSCMNDVIKARVSSAKRMLRHSDMKISTISEKCGYKNVEHFTRLFKSITGSTPGKYRGNK